MCGIVGTVSRRGGVQPDVLRAQRDTLAHRGPDDSGLWVSSDGAVGLGHRRLSVLDLSSAGHQPMCDRARQTRLVFNGEIYNFLDLRRELESLGYRFASRTDTEVLLAAYSCWDESFLSRLNGMFALALYDEGRRRILLARDRAGEKPLFYRESQDGLRFASELKALMADPGLVRVMDGAALEHYLAYGYVPGALCILEGVRKLAPAHALCYELKTGRSRLWRYWRLPEATPETVGSHPSELVDELEHLLEDAVRRQLIADVPVGVLLSGGVDSSIISALAARGSGSQIKTFTVRFPGHGAYDETPFARQVARHLSTDHNELIAEPATVELLPLLARQYDEPLADSSMVPTHILSRLIREHATVALSGDGGDELFGGYPHHSWAVRQEQVRARIPMFVRKVVSVGAARLPLGLRGRNHLVGVAGPLSNAIAHFNLLFDAGARDRLLPDSHGRPYRDAPEAFKASLCCASCSAGRQATRVDFQSYLADDILVKVDRASMLSSLEVRAPYLDYRVIEYAFSRVPDALRATASQRKVLLRMLGRRLLPSSLDLRRKQGFSVPLTAWLKGRWGEFLASTLQEAPASLLVSAEVRALIRGQKRGLANSQRLFSLAMLELWRRAYSV